MYHNCYEERDKIVNELRDIAVKLYLCKNRTSTECHRLKHKQKKLRKQLKEMYG